MSYVRRFTKHPAETIDYDVDFSAWLAARADTVASFTVESDNGLQIVSSALLVGKVRTFVAGGLNGRAYSVATTLVTVGGRTKRSVILVRVRGTGVVDGVPIDGGTGDETQYVLPTIDAGVI